MPMDNAAHDKVLHHNKVAFINYLAAVFAAFGSFLFGYDRSVPSPDETRKVCIANEPFVVVLSDRLSRRPTIAFTNTFMRKTHPW